MLILQYVAFKYFLQITTLLMMSQVNNKMIDLLTRNRKHFVIRTSWPQNSPRPQPVDYN